MAPLLGLLGPESCSKTIPRPVLFQLEGNIPVAVSNASIMYTCYIIISLLQSEPLFSCLMNCEEFLKLLTTSSGNSL